MFRQSWGRYCVTRSQCCFAGHSRQHVSESSLPLPRALQCWEAFCMASLTKSMLCCARCSHAGPPPLLSHTHCAGVTGCPPFVFCAPCRPAWCGLRVATHACSPHAPTKRTRGVQCTMQRAGRWYTRCPVACSRHQLLLGAWGEIGYSTVLSISRVGPHLEIPGARATCVPYSANRAAGFRFPLH